MDTHNFVLAITTGLLAAPSSRLGRLFNYFDDRFDLTGIPARERAGVIVQDCSAVRTSLKHWVQEMRQAGAATTMLGLSPEDISGDAYKMAGLPGGRPWTLAISNTPEAAQYMVGTVSDSPRASAKGSDAGVAFALFQRPDTVKLSPPMAPGLARQKFETVLAEAQDFALRASPGFAESFRLALLLCEKTATAGHEQLDRGALRVEVAEHFPADDHAWLDSLMSLVESFAQFEWKAAKVLGLAAISAADVFSAAGSWNSQSFDGTDQALFESLSARLYGAMNGYYAALLST